jgi:ABC-2 type transport system ATP-binding protein
MDLKRLGFMPQESCLYTDLTISETFHYFGKLYCISARRIREKREFFVSLLNLPVEDHRVGCLSGGQLRRISFAVSMINDPSILMLDEPTVRIR